MIIKNLYENQKATVRVEKDHTEEVDICRGVRQGCILSPLLFNVYSEAIMTEALENLDVGVKMNGRLINNLSYADDTVLVASTQEDLQRLVDRVHECSERAGLSINLSKTKVMVIARDPYLRPRISVAGKVLEQVRHYKYLGAWVNEAWESDQEIKTRITKMRKVLCCRKINLRLRTRILHCYIWPVVMYGSESWTIKEVTRRRLEAFAMWC